jgi:hypothetical protein
LSALGGGVSSQAASKRSAASRRFTLPMLGASGAAWAGSAEGCVVCLRRVVFPALWRRVGRRASFIRVNANGAQPFIRHLDQDRRAIRILAPHHRQLIARRSNLNQQAAFDQAVHHRAAGSDGQMLRRNRQQLRVLRAMAQYNPLRV